MARRVSYIHSQALVDAADALPSNIGRARLTHELISAFDLLELDDEAEDGAEIQGARARVVEPIPATHALLGLDSVSSASGSDSDSDGSPPERRTPGSFRLVSAAEGRPTKRRRTDLMGLEDDCPMFPELAEYVTQVGGASIQAARELRDGRADVAIAWTGGRHHGKRGEAAGFCYVQDIVLAILELRLPPKPQPVPSRSPSPSSELSSGSSSSPPPAAPPPKIKRVLYLDIDVHHGDGVETAFHSSPRTLTISVHLHAPLFFPATGSLDSTGPTPPSPASHHALNIALHPGLASSTLLRVFDSCIQPIHDVCKPDAVVLQCGCDGLAGDPCREWNLSLEGMGGVVQRVLSWGVRTLLLGGGGYDNANAARCWAYLTSVALGRPLDLDVSVPASLEPEDYAQFAPSFTLDVPSGNKPDLNTEARLMEVEMAFARYRKALEGKYWPPGQDGNSAE